MKKEQPSIEQLAEEQGMSAELAAVKSAIKYVQDVAENLAAQEGNWAGADLRVLVAHVEKLNQMCLLPALASGCKFIVDDGGQVLSLVSGDQNYVPTGLHLDMSGWEMIGKQNDPDTAEDWNKNWKWCAKAKPEPYELVVVKYPNGHMHIDWTEPDPRHKGVLHFSYQDGEPQFWMPLSTFIDVAPQWAKNEMKPLEPECKMEYALRLTEFQAQSKNS